MHETRERTLVVMPALNEAGSVYAVAREVMAAVDDFADCLVVDDGSRDDTAAEARRAGALVARLPYNLGVGGALRLGFSYARRHGYTSVVQVDADGQHDPRYVRQLVEALATSDLVIGARFAGAGDYTVRGPRKWAMKTLSASIFLMTRARLTDTTSGFKACGPKAIELFFDHMPAEYLGDTVEALVIAARAGCRISQVPVAMRERAAGQPSQGPWRSTKYLARAMMAICVAMIRPVASPRVVL
jgi:glycosyltransferase involved in cell wall biosynthesis